MNSAKAEIEITASSGRLATGLASASRRVSSWASSVARSLDGVFNKPMSKLEIRQAQKKTLGAAASHAIGNLASQAASKGLDILVDAADDVRTFERNLVRFQIIADKSPASMNALRDSITSLSNATGVGRAEILAGAQAYVDITGDVDGATKNVRTFARVATASAATVEDVALAAASMQDHMKIKPEDLEATFSGLINQGKKGAVNLKDFAKEFPILLSKFQRFGIAGKEGTLELGAMFQVVRKGFGSTDEASTGMQAMMAGLIKHADRFKHAGVKIFNVGKDGTKTMRPLALIIEDIGKSKLAKDPTLLNKAFGRGEGEQAYQMLKSHVEMLREMEAAGADAGAVQRDFSAFMESSAGRIDASMNRLKNSIATTFTPERIERFAEAMMKVADISEFASKNAGDVLAGPLWGAWDHPIDKVQSMLGSPSGMRQRLVNPQMMAAAMSYKMLPMEYQRGHNAGEIGRMQKEYNADPENFVATHAMTGPVNPFVPRTKAELAAREHAPGSALGDSEAVVKALQVLGQQLVTALNNSQVKIGDNQIAKASQQATSVRRAPRP